VTTIGIIGSGHVGSSLARAAIDHGYTVVLSNSQGPGSLAELVGELGSSALAATPAEAGTAADFAIVAIPITTIDQIPVEPLADKVVRPGSGRPPTSEAPRCCAASPSLWTAQRRKQTEPTC
jgi:predicted dinucleotide-binding enzyme